MADIYLLLAFLAAMFVFYGAWRGGARMVFGGIACGVWWAAWSIFVFNWGQ